MKTVSQNDKKSKCTGAVEENRREELDSRLAVIQALIPLGLMAVEELLQAEVTQLAGPRYGRQEKQGVRWGSQRGSVYLADQKVPVTVPRVRNRQQQEELSLTSYQALQQPRELDVELLRRIVAGLSQRRYQECAQLTPQAFGLSASTVSRRFITASERHLKQLCERRLESYDIVALFLDGKSFAREEMLIALGVTLLGEKVILGFAQTSTENARACSGLLRDLRERGLTIEQGVLCLIDGSTGLRAAVEKVFGEHVLIQRCQWHKRENVISYLPATQQRRFRRQLQAAYGEATYPAAKAALVEVRRELAVINESAVRSLEEGMEETLTLHRLGLVQELGISFTTTNCLESINAQVERLVRRVCHWRMSHQMQRWLACALLDIEPRLRKVKGYRYLQQLRQAIQRELRIHEREISPAA